MSASSAASSAENAKNSAEAAANSANAAKTFEPTNFYTREEVDSLLKKMVMVSKTQPDNPLEGSAWLKLKG